nr:DNA-directed DNA polymerase [Tanacetum cinerariifolium]
MENTFTPSILQAKPLMRLSKKYTFIEKELIAVVFVFNKFKPYMVLSKTIVYTDHSDPRKRCLPDHLSQIENDETSDDSEVDDNFPGETLMEITTNDTPWFTYFANYLVGDVIPKEVTYQQKKKITDLKNYFWEDPYLSKVCLD